MNATFVGLELRRIGRDPITMFFTAALPAFFYVVFGAAQSFKDAPIGNGNVGMQIMISMAAYGAVTATTGIGAASAVERMQGWGRQLGLTPLRDGSYVAMKAAVALTIAALPVTLIYVLGALTGAEATVTGWFLSAFLLLAGAGLFALYGLAIGLAFRSEAAISAAGGSLVILGFLGNIFYPLGGTMLAIAKFTPLYGYAALARYPVTEGWVLDGTEGALQQEPLWIPVANVLAWLLILATVTTWLVHRSRGRQ